MYRVLDSAIQRNIGEFTKSVGWVQNEWDGTVTMEVQGREWLINELLKGLNRNQFITIDWMDTEEIPLEDEKNFG